MAVHTKKYMHFRNERAGELRQMADLLDKQIGNVLTSPIYTAISELRNSERIPKLKNGDTDENIWGYDIENFTLPLDTLKHVVPNNIEKGEIILNIRLRGAIEDWNTYNDPFVELSFRVMIKGIGEHSTYHFGFHIDKHNGEDSEEPHPIYHLQYDFNPTKSTNPNLGDLFYIDTPRIMHKPMDFILGVGFLTSNFFPTGFQILCEKREFIKLNTTYQQSVWRPYFHTLANKWKPFSENNIIWNPINEICPIFI